MHLDDLKALLQGALKDGQIEVIVVGDISVDDAVKGLQSTLAALPKRHVKTAPIVGDERLQPALKDPIVFNFQGSGDQSVASIAWRTTSTFPDLAAVRTQLVLEKILSQRLFEELRTNQGMTYTPQTQTADSISTPGWGIMRVFANVPTPRIPDFYAAVEKTVSDLKTKEVSDDELERARGPLIHDLQNAQQNNRYWLANLNDAQIDPRRMEGIRTALSDLQKVTAADVQRAAQTYLLDDRSWKLIVAPPSYAGPQVGK
jgi:zinc protease